MRGRISKPVVAFCLRPEDQERIHTEGMFSTIQDHTDVLSLKCQCFFSSITLFKVQENSPICNRSTKTQHCPCKYSKSKRKYSFRDKGCYILGMNPVLKPDHHILVITKVPHSGRSLVSTQTNSGACSPDTLESNK